MNEDKNKGVVSTFLTTEEIEQMHKDIKAGKTVSGARELKEPSQETIQRIFKETKARGVLVIVTDKKIDERFELGKTNAYIGMSAHGVNRDKVQDFLAFLGDLGREDRTIPDDWKTRERQTQEDFVQELLVDTLVNEFVKGRKSKGKGLWGKLFW